jgi:hypothetical protein
MQRPRLVIKPSTVKTRLLLTWGDEEMMRAALPPPGAGHPRSAETLLEGLSLWLRQPLSVVVCAEPGGISSALGLCDGFGFGATTLHYEVEVVDPRKRPRGLGPFRDLRQLDLKGTR